MLIGKRDFTTVFEVFPEKYRDIICGYIERINSLFERYDVVVFMARKAYCFYLALMNNGLIDNTGTCEVYSSRALTYDLKSKLQGKRIALVDDIVVKGKTLEQALSQIIMMDLDKHVDICIAACHSDMVVELTERLENELQGSYAHLDSVSILELTKCIAAYISLSTISYNADGPRYNAHVESFDQIEWIIRDNSAVDISSPLQKKQGVLNCVFHLRPSVLKLQFQDNEICEEVLKGIVVKFRLLYDKPNHKLTVLPIVLLPPLKRATICKLANYLFSMDDCHNKEYNGKDYVNLISMLRYQLERELMEAVFRNRFCILFEYDSSGEYSQFGSLIPISENKRMLSIERDIAYQNAPYVDSFEINELIESAYDFLLNDFRGDFTNIFGIHKQGTYFTLDMLRNKLVGGDPDSYPGVSLVMDILIDKGLIVPEYVFDENNYLVRAYRTGEIMTLTHNEINVLVAFLNAYYNSVNRPLDRVELEKLCVIMYRYCHERHIFRRDAVSDPNNTSQDYYDICYTRYGPRISNSDCKYEIKGENACITRNMTDAGYLTTDDDQKYHVHSNPNIPEHYRRHKAAIYTLATCAAELADNLDVVRTHCLEMTGEPLVDTANDLFTLIAIGDDWKSQVLSLIAEIRLFANLTHTFDPNMILKHIGTVIDAIWSGVWKYRCFSMLDIRMDVVMPLWQKELMKYLLFSQALPENVDQNPDIKLFMNECGEFLIRLAKYYEELKKASGTVGKKCPSRIADLTKVEDGLVDIDRLKGEFCILRNEALALIDVCNLFLEETVFSYSVEKAVYLVNSRVDLPETILRDVHRLDFRGRLSFGNQLVVLWLKDDEKPYPDQIKYIIERCNGIPVQIINCRLRSWMEGVVLCPQTKHARGNYFDRLVQAILQNERQHSGKEAEFLLCKAKEEHFTIPQELCKQLTHYERYEIANDYVVDRYGICFERKEQITVTNNYNFYGTTNAAIETQRDVVINQTITNSDLSSKQLENELEAIKEYLKKVDHKEKEEICEAIDKFKGATNDKKNSLLMNALNKIGKLGENVLVKVAATKVAELISKVDWSTFIPG